MSSLTPRIDELQKNYIINSDMRIAQRGTSFVSPTNAVTLDRWRYNKNSSATHTVTQDADVPTPAQSGYVFNNSLRMALTIADASIANNDYAVLQYLMEGYDWAKLNTKDLTLSFWVKVTGIGAGTGAYSAALTNAGGTWSYVANYTVNALNTWEKKTIHIPATLAGTWTYTNTLGMALYFTLAAGTDYQGTNGAWQVGNKFATSSQVNGLAAGIIDHRFTGICLYEGTFDDPEFSAYGKTFGEELSACKRYYEKTYQVAVTPGSSGELRGNLVARWPTAPASNNELIVEWSFSVTKRTVPTITLYNPNSGAIGTWRSDVPADVSATVASGPALSENFVAVTNNVPTTSAFHRIHITADAEL